jgi:hypothetical protein
MKTSIFRIQILIIAAMLTGISALNGRAEEQPAADASSKKSTGKSAGNLFDMIGLKESAINMPVVSPNIPVNNAASKPSSPLVAQPRISGPAMVKETAPSPAPLPPAKAPRVPAPTMASEQGTAQAAPSQPAPAAPKPRAKPWKNRLFD